MEDTLLVSVSFSGTDVGVLIVGRKKPKQEIEIINAFEGAEAKELYQKLVTKKGEK